MGSGGKFAARGASKSGEWVVESEEWPEGRPRRVYVSWETMRRSIGECDDEVVETVGVRVRVGVYRVVRAVLSRDMATRSLSMLAGRAGRAGGGPGRGVKGTLWGSKLGGSGDCSVESGREMEVVRIWLERDERDERTDSKGRRAGRRGFGVGVWMGIWGIGGGGASWLPVFERKMREPASVSWD